MPIGLWARIVRGVVRRISVARSIVGEVPALFKGRMGGIMIRYEVFGGLYDGCSS